MPVSSLLQAVGYLSGPFEIEPTLLWRIDFWGQGDSNGGAFTLIRKNGLRTHLAALEVGQCDSEET